MVYLYLHPKKKKLQDEEFDVPIAIVRGDPKGKHFGDLLILNTDPKSRGRKTIDLPDSSLFEVIPNTDSRREVIWCCGQSGSGKSYQAKCFAENYHKLYPDRDIYLISKLKEDETLDSADAPIQRLDPETAVEKLQVNNMYECCVIFDDYDTVGPKKLALQLQTLMEDIATMGRRHGKQGCITMLCLSHNITNYRKTRLLLNECHKYIVFPLSSSYHQLRYLLRSYVGLDKDDIRSLRKMGRWVMISRGFPSYLVSAQQAKLLFVD